MKNRKPQKPHEMTGEIIEAYDQLTRAWGLIRMGHSALSGDCFPPEWSIIELFSAVDQLLGESGLVIAEFIDGEMIKTGANDAKNPD